MSYKGQRIEEICGLVVLRPIPIWVSKEGEDEEYIATASPFNIQGSSDDYYNAIEHLRIVITDTYETLEEQEELLNDRLKSQLQLMRKYVRIENV